MNWRECFPEHDACEAGDPFFLRIAWWDDAITDHRYNSGWLGMTDAEGAAIAERLEADRFAYELGILFRWWNL